MYAVKFVGHVGTFGNAGCFPTADKARGWAKLEADGRAFVVTRIDLLPSA